MEIKRNKYLSGPFIYSRIFTREECEQIIAISQKFQLSEGKIRTDQGVITDKTIRSVNCRLFLRDKDNEWIGKKLLLVAHEVNKHYNFNLSYLDEIQVMEYLPGDFYNWHIDLTPDERTCSRKLSIITVLSDSKSYEGGHLTWNISESGHVNDIVQEQGDVILFPSFLPHKVRPVTAGKRFSLVAWVHGDAFV